VNGREIVVFDFAKLEKAVKKRLLVTSSKVEHCLGRDVLLTHLGRIIDEQVDHDVASAGFEKYRHLAAGTRPDVSVTDDPG
jgi:hypothetical protein